MKESLLQCPTCGSALAAQPGGGRKSTSVAYGKHRELQALKWRAFNVFLVAGDCILIGMQPILVHMSKVDGKFLFSPISVNLLVELAKMVFAIIIIIVQIRKQKPGDKRHFEVPAVIKAAKENSLLAVPSILYAINNYLKFIMQLYFKPATVKMLSNLKVLMIAILLRVVMKRRFTAMQWEALVLLLIGISVNQMPCGPASTLSPVSSIAWLYTFLSISIPSMASVYNEYALKSQFETSVHLQNLFMYCYGAAFNFMGIILLNSAGGGDGYNILKGHSKATMFLIVNNALQGMLSSFFFKYADTILKKYSSTIATIFTGLASAALFHHSLTINFVLGISVVLISMHQFFSSEAQQASPKDWDAIEQTTPSSDIATSLLNMTAGANEEANHLARSQSEKELPR
eukprot:SM000232S07924  [mRNA]  locus=s232:50599:54799:- [translate_table: standard]